MSKVPASKLKRTLSTYRIWDPVVDELESKFFEAIYLGDVNTVTDCISKGINPNLVDDDDLTALHHAAIRGDVVMGHALLTSPGIDVDKRNPEGYTALMFACVYGHDEFVKKLLQFDVKLNLTNSNEQTALHLACTRNSLKITRLLVSKGVAINERDVFDNTPLSIAVVDRTSIPITTFLLKSGANATTTKHFPLFLECILNCNTMERLKTIKILLYYGVDIFCQHPISKKNCLHYVGMTGYLPAAHVLVKRGESNLHTTDLVGRTPLKVAWEHRNIEIYKYYNQWIEKKELVSTLEDDIMEGADKLLNEDDEEKFSFISGLD